MKSQVELKVESEVKAKAPYLHGMIARWICNSLTSGTGAYLVTAITKPCFTFTSTEKMDFTAIVKVLMAPDYTREVKAQVVWAKRGDKLHREFTLA